MTNKNLRAMVVPLVLVYAAFQSLVVRNLPHAHIAEKNPNREGMRC